MKYNAGDQVLYRCLGGVMVLLDFLTGLVTPVAPYPASPDGSHESAGKYRLNI